MKVTKIDGLFYAEEGNAWGWGKTSDEAVDVLQMIHNE